MLTTTRLVISADSLIVGFFYYNSPYPNALGSNAVHVLHKDHRLPPPPAAGGSTAIQPQALPMKSQLVEQASKVISDIPLLINIVSKRVRQLNQGRPPLIAVQGRMGQADIALQEVIEGKVIPSDVEEKEGSE